METVCELETVLVERTMYSPEVRVSGMYYVLSVVLYLVLFNVYVLFVMCFLAVTCEVFSAKLKLTNSFSLTSSSSLSFTHRWQS